MRAKGFTLVEIVITIALVSIILGLGLFASQELYRRQGLSHEVDALAVLLIRARDYSLTGLENAPHGVCLTEDAFVLFDSPGTIEMTSRHAAVRVEGLPGCSDGGIVFSLLSATTTDSVITLTEGERAATIEINREGMVRW